MFSNLYQRFEPWLALAMIFARLLITFVDMALDVLVSSTWVVSQLWLLAGIGYGIIVLSCFITALFIYKWYIALYRLGMIETYFPHIHAYVRRLHSLCVFLIFLLQLEHWAVAYQEFCFWKLMHFARRRDSMAKKVNSMGKTVNNVVQIQNYIGQDDDEEEENTTELQKRYELAQQITMGLPYQKVATNLMIALKVYTIIYIYHYIYTIIYHIAMSRLDSCI